MLELLDLSSLQSVRQFAARICSTQNKLDFLINNAGIVRRGYAKSVDGFELTMATNYLGPFLLTELLLPLMERAGQARVINVSSVGHYGSKVWKPEFFIPEKEYSDTKAYDWSKLASVMHARELSKRLDGTGVVAVSLYPGFVKTESKRVSDGFFAAIFWMLSRPLQITSWQGAQTTMYTVLTRHLVPGGYYSNCALKTPAAAALNDDDCKWLWIKSCALVEISSND
ncbi:unnamed protein product [Dicrocoelium dendriticum]|nr:unnamed protein product [Dicrocoelium dendriticum]